MNPHLAKEKKVGGFTKSDVRVDRMISKQSRWSDFELSMNLFILNKAKSKIANYDVLVRQRLDGATSSTGSKK